MKTKILFSQCTENGPRPCVGGDCPTIYESDRNSLIIQGYKITKNDKSSMSLPNGEDVVEIPIDFLKSYFESR